MNFFRRNKEEREQKDPTGTTHKTDWITDIRKVGAKEMISYLRSLPVRGTEYLLVFDGKVSGRYNLNTNINALQLAAGNYLVYAIDVSEKSEEFVFDKIPLASADVTALVRVDVTYVIDDALELFGRNMGDLKPEIKRRLERKVRQVCLEYLPSDAIKAQKDIQHAVLNTQFDFGVKIVDGLVTLELPTETRAAIQDKAIGEKIIQDFASGELEFDTEVEFYNESHPYRVKVFVAYERDFKDPYAEEKMRQRGITNPSARVKSEVERLIRQTFLIETRRTHNFGDIEEATNIAVRKLVFEFGVRISQANIAIIKTDAQKVQEARAADEAELRRVYKTEGIEGLFFKLATNEGWKDRLLGLINNVRDNAQRLQAENERIDDRAFTKLANAVKIGIVDPSDLSSEVEKALGKYLLGNPNNTSSLTGTGRQLGAGSTTDAEDDSVASKNMLNSRNLQGKANTTNIVTDPKPDAPWSGEQADD